jgi:hypothetical protein
MTRRLARLLLTATAVTATTALLATGAASNGPQRSDAEIQISPSLGAADLYPGFDGGDVYFTVTNHSRRPVRVRRLHLGPVRPADPSTCPPDSVSVQPIVVVDLTVPPRGTRTGHIDDVVSMRNDAPAGCQGASFVFDVSVLESLQL